MTPTTRRYLAIILIVVIIVGVGIATYFLFFKKDDPALRVRSVTAQDIIDPHNPANYSKSRLNIYPYGAFEVELIYTIGEEEHVTLFVGNGTYTKDRSSYTFTYDDGYYSQTGTELNRLDKGYTKTYTIGRNRWVTVEAPWGVSYYFGR